VNGALVGKVRRCQTNLPCKRTSRIEGRPENFAIVRTNSVIIGFLVSTTSDGLASDAKIREVSPSLLFLVTLALSGGLEFGNDGRNLSSSCRNWSPRDVM